MELNPNHPTTSTMHDHWHKIAAILVNRMKEKATTITLEEITRIEGQAIIIKEHNGALELRIVGMDEAEKLARREGGLPV